MTSFSVSPSALVYLYGDRFEDLFGGRTRITRNEELPCRGVKVRDKDLATAVVTCTLAFLAGQAQIDLALGTSGRFIKSRVVLVQRRMVQTLWKSDALEAQLLGQVTGVAKKDTAPAVVSRLWESVHEYPWWDVFERVQRSLLAEGCYTLEERTGLKKLLGAKLVPVCARVLALEAEALELHALLARWRSANRELYQQLWTDVTSGITSRAEKPDVDL